MQRNLTFMLGLALLAAACSSSASDTTGGTLLTTIEPSTTMAPTSTTTLQATTTTVPPTTTTSTTSTTLAATADDGGTDVAGAGKGNTADTLVQLPFTGAEPSVTVVALLALILGAWLVQRSGIWQVRLARLESRSWRRPGAPSADPSQRPPWPPNAATPVTDIDRQFRLRARQLANGYGISFLGGVDAFATEWARSADLSEPADGDDPVSRWKAQLSRELARIYRID